MSFGLSNQDVARLERRRVCLLKLGWVRLEEPLRWRGRVKTARVSCEAGRWYLSLATDWQRRRGPAPAVSAGVDVGLKTLATVASANGVVERRFENPRALDAVARRFERAARAVSRRQRGSARWQKAVARLGRLHARVTALRRDAGEKATTAIARAVGWVGIEDLSINGMLRNHRMARRVAAASMPRGL